MPRKTRPHASRIGELFGGVAFQARRIAIRRALYLPFYNLEILLINGKINLVLLLQGSRRMVWKFFSLSRLRWEQHGFLSANSKESIPGAKNQKNSSLALSAQAHESRGPFYYFLDLP